MTAIEASIWQIWKVQRINDLLVHRLESNGTMLYQIWYAVVSLLILVFTILFWKIYYVVRTYDLMHLLLLKVCWIFKGDWIFLYYPYYGKNSAFQCICLCRKWYIPCTSIISIFELGCWHLAQSFLWSGHLRHYSMFNCRNLVMLNVSDLYMAMHGIL